MNTTKVDGSKPAAGPVERPVRPRAWLTTRTCDGTQGLMIGEATANEAYTKAHKAWLWEPLYDQAALDAAVAAERERILRDVAGLHMAQSVNNQNYPSAWHDGVDAALDAIRRGA